MIKAFLFVVLGALAGFFVGRYIHAQYKDKNLYYGGFVDFIKSMQNNISYKQDHLDVFIQKIRPSINAVFNEQLDNAIKFFEGKDLVIHRIAEKKDHRKIKEFFNEIGTVDIFTQREMLKNSLDYFEARQKECEKEIKKNGTLYYKLCILAGIALGILLM